MVVTLYLDKEHCHTQPEDMSHHAVARIIAQALLAVFSHTSAEASITRLLPSLAPDEVHQAESDPLRWREHAERQELFSTIHWGQERAPIRKTGSLSFRVGSSFKFRFARDGCRSRSKTGGPGEFTTESAE